MRQTEPMCGDSGAVPADRLVGAFGRLESAWPVHGSCRSSATAWFMRWPAGLPSWTAGIHASVLDAASGRLVEQKRIAFSHDMKVGTGRLGAEETGALTDLLVCDQQDYMVYMRQHVLFVPWLEEKSSAQKLLAERSPLHALGGLRDDSWFSRTRWFLGNKPFGDYLVFDTQRVYGVRARTDRSGDGGLFVPAQKGYELFAARRRSTGNEAVAGRELVGSGASSRGRHGVGRQGSVCRRHTRRARSGRSLGCLRGAVRRRTPRGGRGQRPYPANHPSPGRTLLRRNVRIRRAIVCHHAGGPSAVLRPPLAHISHHLVGQRAGRCQTPSEANTSSCPPIP